MSLSDINTKLHQIKDDLKTLARMFEDEFFISDNSDEDRTKKDYSEFFYQKKHVIEVAVHILDFHLSCIHTALVSDVLWSQAWEKIEYKSLLGIFPVACHDYCNQSRTVQRKICRQYPAGLPRG